ncbi:MAG: hypothetical protein EKK37_16030 [Sphingobacteriales bacterium]|nr:MAG: hypothetical protein EKK37_16030 [Sphingobacteriales bacterium]
MSEGKGKFIVTYSGFRYRMGKHFVSILIILCIPVFTNAQRVLYSPFIGDADNVRFEVIGKAGNYYWVQKSKKKNKGKKIVTPWIDDKDPGFDIYDQRMNLVKTVTTSFSDTILKEYFVAGTAHMDQLVFTKQKDSTVVLLNRYSDNGEKDSVASLICSFPFNMSGNDFLLVRSQDKNKLLLLGFETVPDTAMKLHSFLFDKNWTLLNHQLIQNPHFTQPFIQYDFIDYPLEHFTNCPLKLANNGEWLMLSSTMVNQGSLLFHFTDTSSRFEMRTIRVPKNSSIQDVCLSLNNEKREVMAGVLSQYRSPLAKSVRMLQYSLDTCNILYDTIYKFNTIAATKTTSKTKFEEYFMTVPDKGFLLLKEYGRPYGEKYSAEDLQKEEEVRYASNSTIQSNRNDYTRYNHLAGTKELYDRGDLSMYYFSASGKDSCWSGIINKEQSGELTNGNLSYVFLPSDDKLFFLYNSFHQQDEIGSSTILDVNGNPLNEGLVYWNIRSTLLFQRARQISDKEIAVPYERNARNGFAIVKL